MIPESPVVEKIGGQYYVDGAVWPFTMLPLVYGLAVKGDISIAWAVTWSGTMGINGYARVPLEGHPWPGQYGNYDNLPVEVHGGLTYGPQLPREESEWELNGNSGKIPAMPGRTWVELGGWIGFDTGHAWDIWTPEEIARIEATYPEVRSPEQIARNRRIQEINTEFDLHQRASDPWDKVWTLEAVADEATRLAIQIAIAQEEFDASS